MSTFPVITYLESCFRRAGFPILAVIFVSAGAATAQTASNTNATGMAAETADSSAVLSGKVVSATTGKPVGGARISVVKLRRGAISDDQGRFDVVNLRPGVYDVRVHYLGYSTNERPVRLEPGHTTETVFLLRRNVLKVADLEVVVEGSSAKELPGFERRLRQGLGNFVTQETIREWRPEHTSEIMRDIPGVVVSPTSHGVEEVKMKRSGKYCTPIVYLDGVRTRNYRINNIDPSDIYGIEVYVRPAEVPLQFKATSEGCGVMVIWTRRGGAFAGR